MTTTQSYHHHHHQYYTPSPTLPIAMPAKTPTPFPPHPYPRGLVPGSPPEAPNSVTTSGSGAAPSYDPSATSSSYAGSASDYESASANGGAVQGVDLIEYMGDRMAGAFDAMPLDRSLARQAQTSGELNAKTRELLQLQALARSRLAATQANFADGIRAAKDVQRDLEWTQKRVSSINQRAARNYPEQYKMAAQRYPAPVDY